MVKSLTLRSDQTLLAGSCTNQGDACALRSCVLVAPDLLRTTWLMLHRRKLKPALRDIWPTAAPMMSTKGSVSLFITSSSARFQIGLKRTRSGTLSSLEIG